MADPAVATTLKTLQGVQRGLEMTFGGKSAEEATPLIRDQDVMVNLTSEIAPLLASIPTAGAATALTIGKIAKAFVDVTPKAKAFISALGGAGAEASISTEEAGTLREDLFGGKDLTAEEKKLQLLMEAVGMEAFTQYGGAAVDQVGRIPVIGFFVRALPTMLASGEKTAKGLVAENITSLLNKAEGAKTPKQRLAVLQQLRKEMANNFERQTGVKFDDYIKASQRDAEDIARGMDPDRISEQGQVAQLFPIIGETRDGKPIRAFIPQTPDIVTSDVVRRLGSGVASKEGLAETVGAREAQDLAIEAQTRQLAEPTLPEAETVRSTEEIAEQAEKRGDEARSAIRQVVEQRKGDIQKKEVEALADLDNAIRDLREVADLGDTTGGRMRLVADDASKQATEIFQGSYSSQLNTKQQNYDNYLNKAQEITIEADEFNQSLGELIGSPEIANIVQVEKAQFAPIKTTLNQLEEQRRRLDAEIEKQVTEYVQAQTKGLTGKAKADAAQKARKEAPIDRDAAKKAAGYQDVKLSNVEGLLQAVNAAKRDATGAEMKALDDLSAGVEQLIKSKVADDIEASSLREGAIEYFQTFNDLYRYVPGDTKRLFQFGDAITPTEFAVAQEGFTGLLRNASRNQDDFKTLMNVRSQLPEDQLKKFDESVTQFFESDIYAGLNLNLTNIIETGTNEQLVSAANRTAKAIENKINSQAFAYLGEFAPEVTNRLQKTVDDLRASTGSAKEATSALAKVQDEVKQVTKNIEGSEEAIFSDPMSNTKFSRNSVKAMVKLINDPDAGEYFESAWNVAGTVGRKGDDGLTQAQRDMRTVAAQGLSEILLTDKGKLRKLASDIDAVSIEDITSSKLVALAFPEGSAVRQNLDQLIESIVQTGVSRQAAKLQGESITGILRDAQDLVQTFIKFEQGPLSREGRRSSMIARAFFAVVGGQARVGEILVDVFTDPKVADEILAEQERIIKMGLEGKDQAYRKALGRYLMRRLGVSSIDELREDVEARVISEQMRELE